MATTRAYFIPGWGYMNEVKGNAYFVPGWSYANETVTTSTYAPILERGFTNMPGGAVNFTTGARNG